MNNSKRIYLSQSELPNAWYNLQADLPEPAAAAAAPGHEAAARAGRLGADLRQGADRARK